MADDQNDKKDEFAPSTSSNVVKKRFELVKFTGIAMGSWDVTVDNCAICRNHIAENCLGCQAIKSDDVCTVARGLCQHTFHYHCISRWTQIRNVCPLDNIEWKLLKIGK